MMMTLAALLVSACVMRVDDPPAAVIEYDDTQEVTALAGFICKVYDQGCPAGSWIIDTTTGRPVGCNAACVGSCNTCTGGNAAAKLCTVRPGATCDPIPGSGSGAYVLCGARTNGTCAAGTTCGCTAGAPIPGSTCKVRQCV